MLSFAFARLADGVAREDAPRDDGDDGVDPRGVAGVSRQPGRAGAGRHGDRDFSSPGAKT